jgi:hypothetical protein
MKTKRWVVLFLALTVPLAALTLVRAQRSKPLTEADLVKRLKLLEEDELVTLVRTRGVGFVVDEPALKRLQKAGASAVVLAAVRKAGAAPASAIDYEGVLKLLRGGASEAEVLRRLEESPTRFTLSPAQVKELRTAGASARVLAEMQRNRLKVSSDVTDYALILDCSGSMNDRTPDGVTKMEAAKRVVSELIRDLPNGKRLTFVVYGHNLKEECKAVLVAAARRELSDDYKDKLVRWIAHLRAVGHTPMALALQRVREELAGKVPGLCEVVLITDGMETCHGDPAREARALAAALKLAGGVNVIGFDIQPRERAAVRTIAAAGGGKHYDARTARELGDKVRILARARAAAAQARRAEEAFGEARAAATRARKAATEARTVGAGVKAAAAEVRTAAGHAERAEKAAGEAETAAGHARGAAARTAKAGKVEEAAVEAGEARAHARKGERAARTAREAARSASEARAAVVKVVAGAARPGAFMSAGLEGWEGLMEYWSYKDGRLTGSAPPGRKLNTFLCSKKKYKDFEMKFKVRLTGGKGNSGVQIRSAVFDRRTFAVRGPQCDIGEKYWGDLYGEGLDRILKAGAREAQRAVKPADFNDYFIKCVGKHVTIKINGVTSVDDDFPTLPDEGILAWQLRSDGPMQVTFKDIEFKEIKDAGRLTRPRAGPPEGFEALFNGKDLTGWRFFNSNRGEWEATDGLLVARGGRGGLGGWLMTEKEYADFELRLEYRLSARANSGVALRAPLAGQPAWQGMEIQILDDEGYPRLPGTQYNGSLFGVVPPSRRAARPAGQWNQMTILARGRRVTVAINGVRVLDANLDASRAFFKRHPGLLRARGHLGVQVHTGRAEFRNLYVKPL